jgi:pimeloyl-ACP methyl ester carboxylesterase
MNGQTIAAMRNEAHRRYKRIFSGAWEWQELSPINTIQEIETEILLLHDREDREVPYLHAENLIAIAPNTKLISTSGLGHKKILRDETCLQSCLDFIAQKKNHLM